MLAGEACSRLSNDTAVGRPLPHRKQQSVNTAPVAQDRLAELGFGMPEPVMSLLELVLALFLAVCGYPSLRQPSSALAPLTPYCFLPLYGAEPFQTALLGFAAVRLLMALVAGQLAQGTAGQQRNLLAWLLLTLAFGSGVATSRREKVFAPTPSALSLIVSTAAG